jgi:hypothetical protein
MIAILRTSAITFRKCTLLKLAYIILNMVDLGLTLYAVSHGAQELNPFMRSMFEAPYQLYIVKFVLPVFLAWLLPGPLIIPSIAALVFVIGWDLNQLSVFFIH